MTPTKKNGNGVNYKVVSWALWGILVLLGGLLYRGIAEDVNKCEAAVNQRVEKQQYNHDMDRLEGKIDWIVQKLSQ